MESSIVLDILVFFGMNANQTEVHPHWHVLCIFVKKSYILKIFEYDLFTMNLLQKHSYSNNLEKVTLDHSYFLFFFTLATSLALVNSVFLLYKNRIAIISLFEYAKSGISYPIHIYVHIYVCMFFTNYLQTYHVVYR